jgi:AraC-like DNA-binding protein
MVLLDHGGRAAGEVVIVAPPADLSAIVEHFWIAHRPHLSAPRWRVVPDTSSHVIAMLTARARKREIRTVVVGARSRAADIDVSERVLTIGMRLRPGVLPILTNASAREFADRSVSMDDAFPTRALNDLELGADAPAPWILHELIRLTRRLCHQRVVSTPLSKAVAATTVAELARQLQTPTRSLRERAYREVGLSPKRMLRVLRLHDALHAGRRHHVPWSEIAYAAGYADQAHFTREVRALLGEPPSAWAARGSADLFKTPPARFR